VLKVLQHCQLHHIKEAVEVMKLERVNACWRDLWSECVNDFAGFPIIDNEVRRIIQVARQVECDGFVDILDKEIEELIERHQETSTNEMLQEIRRSSTEDEGDDYEQEEPKNLESA
jgi:hypothetical protein